MHAIVLALNPSQDFFGVLVSTMAQYPPNKPYEPGPAYQQGGYQQMPYMPDPYAQDKSHLNLLAIFYFVKAGLSLFGALICLIEAIIGIVMIFGSQQTKGQDAEMMLIMGIAWACIGGIAFLISTIAGVLQLMAGRKLQKRTGRTFCFVVAIITALSIPLGTILAVFTFVVLNRPSVQQMFDAKK